MQKSRVDWTIPGGTRALELYGPAHSTEAPVIFLGGLGLGADWSFYPYLAEQVGRDRPVVVPLPPRPYSLSAEREALAALLAALAGGECPPGTSWESGEVGLIGHAKGASLGMLLAAEVSAVEAVVAIAPLCTFNRLAEADPTIRDDVTRHADRFQLEVAVRSLTRCSVVVIAGEEDFVVPIVEAETVFHWLPKEASSLVLLEKTGHSLGAEHPFQGSNRELERVVEIARQLFARVL